MPDYTFTDDHGDKLTVSLGRTSAAFFIHPAGGAVAEVDIPRDAVATLRDELDPWLPPRSTPATEVGRLRKTIDEQQAELAAREHRLNAAETVIEGLRQSIERRDEVPYTDEHRQRIAALLSARDAALSVGSKGGMKQAFSGGGSEQVDQPAVLSLAHFVMTGERDYVTVDHQYVERQAPVIHAGMLDTTSGSEWAEKRYGGDDHDHE